MGRAGAISSRNAGFGTEGLRRTDLPRTQLAVPVFNRRLPLDPRHLVFSHAAHYTH